MVDRKALQTTFNNVFFQKHQKEEKEGDVQAQQHWITTHHSEADMLPSELRVTSLSAGGSDSSAPAGGGIFLSQSSTKKETNSIETCKKKV